MKHVSDLGIGVKVQLISLAGAVAVGVLGFVGVSGAQRAASAATELHDEAMHEVGEAYEVEVAAAQARIYTARYAVVRSEADRASTIEAIDDWDAKADAALAAYAEGQRGDAEGTALAEAMGAALANYRTVRTEQFFTAVTAGPDEAARVLQSALSTAAVDVAERGDALVQHELDIARDVRDETVSGSNRTKTMMLVFALAGVAAMLAIGRAVSRLIIRPIDKVVDALDQVAGGDLRVATGVTSQDEIGRMAASLDRTVERTRTLVESIAEQAQHVGSSSTELSAVSSQLASSAEETATQASSVSASATEVSANVQMVAAAAEELGATVREVAASAQHASMVATEAAATASQAETIVDQLARSSSKIDDVVRVISDIAEQTNLLALNATIEAARAGEAGKGFAVVAAEVKELAQATGAATGEIGRTVQTIQGDTRLAVESLRRITEVIGTINETQTSIAGAVEQQSATTNEVVIQVTRAAGGVGDIASSVNDVARAASVGTEGAANAQVAATSLSHTAERLRELVAGFNC